MATVRETKTSRRSKARLPVTLFGPTQWLTGLNWVQTFLEARERMGIPFPQVPLFPIKEGNSWKKGQGRLQDFNAGMKMVMAQMMHKPGSVATSHGLKATPLAWACAFGIAEEERTAL
eukprot:628079-Karenia_brevis.AAC.1